MSGVFSDYKITIFNEWSKQWSQYQHSWQSEVTHILNLEFWISGVNNDPSINILDRVKSLISYNLEFWISGVNNDPSINILDRVKSLIS